MPQAGVIDFFLHPPFGLMQASTTSPLAITNPYTGNPTFALGGPATAFGITWEVNLAPSRAGRQLGDMVVYEDRVIQLVVFHTLAIGGSVASEIFESHNDSGIFMWTTALPTSIALTIFPNFELNLAWLIGV